MPTAPATTDHGFTVHLNSEQTWVLVDAAARGTYDTTTARRAARPGQTGADVIADLAAVGLAEAEDERGWHWRPTDAALDTVSLMDPAADAVGLATAEMTAALWHAHIAWAQRWIPHHRTARRAG